MIQVLGCATLNAVIIIDFAEEAELRQMVETLKIGPFCRINRSNFAKGQCCAFTFSR